MASTATSRIPEFLFPSLRIILFVQTSHLEALPAPDVGRTQTCQISSQNPSSGRAVSLGGGGGDAMDLEKESEASLFSRRQRGILGCWSKCQFPYKGLAVQWGKAKERQARFLF